MGNYYSHRYLLLHLGCLCCGIDPHPVKVFQTAEAAYAHRETLRGQEETEPECFHYTVFDMADIKVDE